MMRSFRVLKISTTKIIDRSELSSQFSFNLILSLKNSLYQIVKLKIRFLEYLEIRSYSKIEPRLIAKIDKLSSSPQNL